MTTISICRDEDCPRCGWPETYAAGDSETGPTEIGCRKCGWSEPVMTCRYCHQQITRDETGLADATGAYQCRSDTGDFGFHVIGAES